jgi:hypothetical protein
VNATGENALERLSKNTWFEVGHKAALAYERDHKWLFRRVEAIEFVDRRSVRRTVIVDFEVPRKLHDLHSQGKAGPKKTFLVPIAMLQKWPPTMDFQLEDGAGNTLSRYRSRTTKRLDFGLLMGTIDLALTEKRKKKSKRRKKKPSATISLGLQQELAEIVDDPQPSQEKVTRVVNELSAELKELRPPTQDRWEQPKGSRDLVVAAVDLAARLAGCSILWVAVSGRKKEDQIVKFSYQGAHLVRSPRFAEDEGHEDRRTGPLRRAAAPFKRIATSCSWRGRTLVIPLLHGGQRTRYHLNMHAPPGSVEMREATAIVLPPADPYGDRDTKPRSLSVTALAAKYRTADYRKFLKAPDEWVGPESSGYLMDYGEPTVLATTDKTVAVNSVTDRPKDASAEIIDRQTHVYSGAAGAPSHRMLLQLKLKAAREGLITGCLLAAIAIAALMWTIDLRLPEATRHIGTTVVLLSLVPVVLAYVVVRPNEQPFEHEHLLGVRMMAVFAGALPLSGATYLILTHKHVDLDKLETVWFWLSFASLVLLAGLILSFALSASPKKPTEPAPTGRRP